MKRLFVAVNLPESAKEELLSYQEMWVELPGTWTKRENLHATLAFLGNKSEQEEQEIRSILKKVAAKHAPFTMHISRIAYGPPKTTPLMIWAIGESQNEFLSLKRDIEKGLTTSPVLRFEPKQEDAIVHLTLLRLDKWAFAAMEEEERPIIEEEIDLSFPVNSFELMESKFGGSQYTVLASFRLVK
ncbi:MAG: RNA 2',3'-cyclic phosphodiesterase [Parcubacteria group bacterium]|nr:RNA 2',3'-cyclic phosphodiesterase [Parcubacteria group bacterium]